MNIKNELLKIFRYVFDDDELNISDETTANDIDDWDSLTHMQLIVEIEKKFSMKFSVDEVVSAKNVGEFVAMIEKKLDNK